MWRLVCGWFVAIVLAPPFVAAQTAEAKHPRVELTREPTTKEPAVSVSGVVLSNSGEPVADAAVVLRSNAGGTFYSMGLLHNRDVLARATTAANGKFMFSGVGLPPRMTDTIETMGRGMGGVQLVVLSKGMAIYWTELKSFQAEKPLEIKLAAEAPASGAVLDEAGKPIPGVTVRFHNATKDTTETEGFFRAPGELNLNLSEVNISAVTDADGKFELHHLPSGHRLFIVCTAPNYARQVFALDTGNEADLRQMKTTSGGRETVNVKRAPMSITLSPAKSVTVKVLDHDGKPVTDGAIQVITEQRHFGGWQAVDPHGVARIQLKEFGKLEFQYGNDPLEPRLGSAVTAEIKEQDESPSVEIRLPKSVLIAGRVVDAETGEPIPGAYIHYGSSKQVGTVSSSGFSLCVSDNDGKFQVPALPGPGRLGFSKDIAGYFPPYFANAADRKAETRLRRTVEVPESGSIEPVELKVARGLEVRGIVRDAAGKPVAGAKVRGDNVDSPHKHASAVTSDDGRFLLRGLSPHAKTRVTVAGDAGAAEQDIDGQPDLSWDKTRVEEVELKLRSGVRLTGRVLKEGKPLAGVQMKLSKSVPIDTSRARIQPLGEVETDADGKYAIGGLGVGDRYHFEIIAPDGMTAPGWRHQSPYIAKVPDKADGDVKLPDMNLISMGQTLRGIVVDPDGKPVPGITISPRLVSGDFISRSQPRGRAPWMDTNEQGQFDLTGLPDKPIELMAYKGNPAGGRIRYSSKVRPKQNQQDIRIVYDPSLGSGIEDLDKAEAK